MFDPEENVNIFGKRFQIYPQNDRVIDIQKN